MTTGIWGYLIAIVVLFYFFVIWPANDDLPPKNKRTQRQRLAGKHGLHDKPSVGELWLAPSQKEELLSLITFMDGRTYSQIAKSNHFYLVESRRSILSLYCSVENPIGRVDYEMLQTKNFISINIEEHLLVRFLKELRPLKKVE